MGCPDDLDAIHWGHVGDIAQTRAGLQTLSDRLFAEGEHAQAKTA